MTEMTNAGDARGTGDAAGERPGEEAVPWFARRVAWGALHAGRVSGAKVVAGAFRRKAMKRGAERFTVVGSDGVELACLRLPGRGGADALAERLTVFVMHGWVECKELHLFRSYPLQDAGHDVVLIDHRGHGGSSGVGVTFGVKEREDLSAVIDEAARRGWIGPSGRVITMGHSMGAATCLLHAAIDERVAGVVAMGPYATITDAIRAFRRRLPGIDLVYPWRWAARAFACELDRLGGSIDEAEPLRAMQRVTAPVLLIEGGRDTLVPPAEHTQRLMDATRGGPVERVRVERANHFTLSRLAWRGVGERVTRFCREVSEAIERGDDPAGVVRDGHTESLTK